MAPKSAANNFRLAAARPAQLSQWERLEIFRKEAAFCDVVVKSTDGKDFSAHAVVLASASDKLRKLLEQAKPRAKTQQEVAGANGHEESRSFRELAASSSSDAVSAVLDFVYSGMAQLAPQTVPEVARLARRWDLSGLQETLAASLSEDGGLTPEVVAGLFALGEPFGEQLGAAARAFVLANFSACARTEPFLRWPQKVLEVILKSDKLVVSNEEEALLWVAKWRSAKDGREAAAVPALAAIRWPLLSLPALDALIADAKGAAEGSFCSVVAEKCKAAKSAHHGMADSASIASLVPHLRQAFPGWWAGLGASGNGGSVIAGAGLQGKAGQESLKPRAIRIHEGTLLFLDDAKEPGRVIQWFLRMQSGRPVAGSGSELVGTGSNFEDMADIWSGPDDAFYILDRDAEHVVRVRSGEADVVSKGTIRLERPCAVVVEGVDRAVYVLDREGTRVVRFVNGRSSQVAGSTEAGNGAGHLNAGPTGRLYVARGGRLYISDTLNHRVQRWDPGAKAGVTVAGGHGCGSGADQLSHPGGVWALDNGTLYVADTGNHRVMKWRDGARAGVLAAGGYGSGDELHQLKEPLDVAVESSGGLLVADHGNARVVRWAPRDPPSELLAAVKG